MFAPIILPNESSGMPPSAAVMPINSSGTDTATDIIKKAVIKSCHPRNRAIRCKDRTNQSPAIASMILESKKMKIWRSTLLLGLRIFEWEARNNQLYVLDFLTQLLRFFHHFSHYRETPSPEF